MSKFAKKTQVPVDRSRSDIEKVLGRYKATGFLYGRSEDNSLSVIGFRLGERMVKVLLPMPLRDWPVYNLVPLRHSSKPRPKAQGDAMYEQDCRQRWRALHLLILAKLEAIESGITSIDEVFLENIVMPNQQTVGQWVTPQLQKMYSGGHMPPLLPGAK